MVKLNRNPDRLSLESTLTVLFVILIPFLKFEIASKKKVKTSGF